MKPLRYIPVIGMLVACSSLDFFQYRENTGLYVLEKPEGYDTVKFGSRLAASGDESGDYMAVSGGQGTSTLIYGLAEDGNLLDLTGYKYDYPGGASNYRSEDAISNGSGASLVGLPLFAQNGERVSGCIAVGEPSATGIVFWCPEKNDTFSLKAPKISNFGQSLAAVSPPDGTQSLLIAGGSTSFQIISDMVNDAATRSNVVDLNDEDRILTGLAGGLIPGTNGTPNRLFVAVDSMDEAADEGNNRVVIFVQNQFDPKVFEKAVCLENSDNAGFGGSLAAGDLDGDGAYELVVGAASGFSVYDSTVRIFDVPALLDAAQDTECMDITVNDSPILATVGPDEGDFDVACNDDCAFGSTLAIGDIATDDTGPELIIGAPAASAEGVSKSGAVYIYRGWSRTSSGDGDTYKDIELAGQVFDSTPEGGKQFGTAVAVAPMAGRNELLISAAGEGKVFIAYCTGIGEDITSGADVTKDANGKIVSTRCRL